MGVEFVTASADHIEAIARNMRHADVMEAAASGYPDPVKALSDSLAHSSMAVSAIIDGNPAAMFGASDINILASIGAPWMLATPAVSSDMRRFLRQSIHWRGQLLERYDTLRNVVDDRNHAAKRWLAWMGFRFSEPMPIGVNGEMFRVFELRR